MNNDNQQPSEGTYQTPEGVFAGVPSIGMKPMEGYAPKAAVAVGGVVLCDKPIEYNVGRRTTLLTVRNTGDRPIQVGSHFHFFEVNRYLQFDRDKAFGCHLNIPSTTAIRFEPGDTKQVELVTYSGKRRVVGFNGLVNGYTGGEDTPTYYPVRIKAIKKMEKLGFNMIDESTAAAEFNKNNTNKK